MKGDPQRTKSCPVCGMKVNSTLPDLVSAYKGQNYYFCARGCQEAFEKNPDNYLKPKGFFGRFLERLAKSNEEAFGPEGPSCCHSGPKKSM